MESEILDTFQSVECDKQCTYNKIHIQKCLKLLEFLCFFLCIWDKYCHIFHFLLVDLEWVNWQKYWTLIHFGQTTSCKIEVKMHWFLYQLRKIYEIFFWQTIIWPVYFEYFLLDLIWHRPNYLNLANEVKNGAYKL